MKATINALANGAWAKREGQAVTIVAVKPNGLASGIRFTGERKVRFVPTRWLTKEEG